MAKPCIYRRPRTLSRKDLDGEIRVLERLETELGSGFYARHKVEFYRLRSLRAEWSRRRQAGEA